jgi:hypothetical protein
MKYEVRFQIDNSLKESTDDLGKAKATAISMGNWNRPCNVIETETGEVVYEGKAYSSAVEV